MGFLVFKVKPFKHSFITFAYWFCGFALSNVSTVLKKEKKNIAVNA